MKLPSIVLLAGGNGTRFRPFKTNKLLWPFCGQPFLKHILDMVVEAGFTDVICITSPETEHFVSSLHYKGIHLQTRLQSVPQGMDDALKSAADLIGSRGILVLNADDLVELNLIQSLASILKDKKPHLFVTALERKAYQPFGYYVEGAGRIVKTIEKPPPDKQPSHLVRLVFDYINDPREFLALIDKTAPGDDRYEQAQSMLLAKYGADFLTYRGSWAKLKYPHSVLEIMELFLQERITSSIHPSAFVSPQASIEGIVSIDEGVRVEAGSMIKGPTYIGKQVIVGNHALIRSSMIESGTIIGAGCEVARSYVGPHCHLHHTFVGDSVLESEVNMSWGTVTANLRLDLKTVRVRLPNGEVIDTGREKLGALIGHGTLIGVNSSTMPGVILDPDTKVPPHTCYK